MKVAELYTYLEGVPGDYEVILASDAEGNQYNSADDFIRAYAPGRGRDIEVDDDVYVEEYNAVVIFPV